MNTFTAHLSNKRQAQKVRLTYIFTQIAVFYLIYCLLDVSTVRLYNAGNWRSNNFTCYEHYNI